MIIRGVRKLVELVGICIKSSNDYPREIIKILYIL